MPPTTLYDVDLSRCRELVVKPSHLHLLGNTAWTMIGFVAVKNNLLRELEDLDTMLRENQTDSLELRLQFFHDWVRSRSLMTDGGLLASPSCYFKTDMTEDWIGCETSFSNRLHVRKRERLHYNYFWFFLRSGFLNHVCLATLVGAMREGMCTLHPQNASNKGLMYIHHFPLSFVAHITLSGYIRK